MDEGVGRRSSKENAERGGRRWGKEEGGRRSYEKEQGGERR